MDEQVLFELKRRIPGPKEHIENAKIFFALSVLSFVLSIPFYLFFKMAGEEENFPVCLSLLFLLGMGHILFGILNYKNIKIKIVKIKPKRVVITQNSLMKYKGEELTHEVKWSEIEEFIPGYWKHSWEIRGFYLRRSKGFEFSVDIFDGFDKKDIWSAIKIILDQQKTYQFEINKRMKKQLDKFGRIGVEGKRRL